MRQGRPMNTMLPTSNHTMRELQRVGSSSDGRRNGTAAGHRTSRLDHAGVRALRDTMERSGDRSTALRTHRSDIAPSCLKSRPCSPQWKKENKTGEQKKQYLHFLKLQHVVQKKGTKESKSLHRPTRPSSSCASDRRVKLGFSTWKVRMV